MLPAMPFNVSQGSTVTFTAEFFDSGGAMTVPSSATLTIVYPVSNTTTTSCSIGMSAAGNFFTATWGSGVSELGLATFSVSGAGQATPTTGTLRIITP
jgi:hypothetical protein